MNRPIYLDHHATTPVDKKVLEVMLPFFADSFGNASSLDHKYGNEAAAAVSEARAIIAKAINAEYPDEIIFTSGATESDNLALLGIARKLQYKGKHIITTKIEHKAVMEACKKLEKEGFNISYLEVDKNGCISIDALKNTISDHTILVSIMAANNEIGTIYPLEKIGSLTREKGIIFHTDAAQAFGNIPIDVQKMKIDALSASGHKIYGPKGVGILYLKGFDPNVDPEPLQFGGGQEKDIRPGTLNVPGIVGFGEAAKLAVEDMKERTIRISELRDDLYSKLKEKVEVEINGNFSEKLPHNLNLHFPSIEAKALINEVEDKIAISAGSACTSEEVSASHVLTAIGCDEDRAFSSIRIGLGRYTTKEEIDVTANVIISAVNKLNKI